ncbi:MAG: ABC transporter ATP-binding protein [Pseudobdellovibrionaceae bacterium]
MKERRSFLDQETRFTGKYQRTVFETLWIAYRPYLPRVIFCLLSGFLGRLAVLANANVIGYWVDSFCDPNESSQCKALPSLFRNFETPNYIFLLFGLTLLGFCFILIFRVLFSRMSALAVSQIYDETTLRTSRQPMSFFDSTPAGRIITRFSSDYGNVFRLFGGPLAELLAIVFDLVAMILLIGFASPFYLPLVVVVGILDFFVFKLNVNRMRTARRNLSASRSPSIAHFAETAQGASTVRSFNKQNSFSQRFEFLDKTYLKNKLDTTKALLSFSFQINCMTALFLLATGAMAWWLLQKSYLSIGSIGVAFSFIALSGTTVQMFFEWISQFEEAMVGVERLDDYIRKPLERGARLPSQAQFQTGHAHFQAHEEESLLKEKLTKEAAAPVQFDRVFFRYREDLPAVLKNLDFEIKAGERFGIVGRTGSGKSSLVQALFYLYPIESGAIRIAGKRPQPLDGSISEDFVDLNLYRRSIAFIAQDPTLFRGTLRENLDITGRIGPEDLFEVLKKVGLPEWANDYDLNRPIEERGRNLSQGERQLISMARCLLQEAPVIVMDEATSSVDPQSEEILVRATEEFFKDKTQIIIAHRLSTLQSCDRILWLQNGEIQLLGPPREVLPVFQRANLERLNPGPRTV